MSDRKDRDSRLGGAAESGDDAAEKIYRRLLARRRRWANPDLVIEDASRLDGPASAEPEREAADDRQPRSRASKDPGARRDFADDGAARPGSGQHHNQQERQERHEEQAQHKPDASTEREVPRDSEGNFDLTRWQPRSHTVRFIKEHPALALAIGIPAVVLLTRKGGVSRALHYAASPAGMARIRQVSTVITALGLLDKSRR